MEEPGVFKQIWDLISQIITLLTPFAILYVTWNHNHREAERKKLEDAENSKLSELTKSVNDSVEEFKTFRKDIKQDIEDIGTQLNEYRDDNQHLRDDLSRITQLNRLNGQYTHELAQLVLVIGEGIRDQHLDGNITRAISKYRKFESDTLGEVMTGNRDIE